VLVFPCLKLPLDVIGGRNDSSHKATILVLTVILEYILYWNVGRNVGRTGKFRRIGNCLDAPQIVIRRAFSIGSSRVIPITCFRPTMSQSGATPTEYIVKLKDGVDMQQHIQTFNDRHNQGDETNHEVHHSWNPEFANAYVGKFIHNAHLIV
jgi:hypothetical protein